jgi:hypothetical protein
LNIESRLSLSFSLLAIVISGIALWQTGHLAYTARNGELKAEEEYRKKLDELPIPKVTIYAYPNPADQKVAHAIKTLLSEPSKGFKIKWANPYIQFSNIPQSAMLIDTLFCTKSASHYVKPIVDYLNNSGEVTIKRVLPTAKHPPEEPVINFGHFDLAVPQPVDIRSAEEAEKICTNSELTS